MESNADEELHSFSPSSPRVGSRARRQDWRENFRSVTCFTLQIFCFQVQVFMFLRWSLTLFPLANSHTSCMWTLERKFSHKVDLPAALGFLWAGRWIHSSKLQLDEVRRILQVDALRMWTKRWTSFWRERRRDQRVAELQVETRWLVVGFQSFLRSISFTPRKKLGKMFKMGHWRKIMENGSIESILIVCHKEIQ